MSPKNTRKIHLHDYLKPGLTFEESGGTSNRIRFSLRKGPETLDLKAFEIDISSSQDAYFKHHYRENRGEGKKSADGIYVGKVRLEEKEISFVIVLELEGKGTEFDDAVVQAEETIQHFCKETRDSSLDDDGYRHHQQTEQYPVDEDHYVIALVVGSDSSRKTMKRPFYYQDNKRIIRYNITTRRPGDNTAEDFIRLLDRSFNILGHAR